MRPILAALLTFAVLPAMARNIAAPPQGLSIVDWSQIRAEYDRHRHTAYPDGDAFKARTRELEWNTRFDGRGFEIQPDHATWRFGLELLGQTNARVTVNKNRVTYTWSPTLEEWFVNESRGLEHGFTILKKSGPIDLRLAVRGELRAEGKGIAIRFVDDSGALVLTYSDLKAWDATGRALPATMEFNGGVLHLTVDDRDARYPVTIDPWVQQAYLKPAAVGSTQAGDNFGAAVAISGDTLVVGAPSENSSSLGVNSIPDELSVESGAAFVFVRSAGTWTQQAYLKPASLGVSPVGTKATQSLDAFGAAVAVSGDTIVIGAYGEDSATLGVNSVANESSNGSGAAYVFVRTAGVWSQQAYLKPAAVALATTLPGDHFGESVAVSGDIVVVGAAYEDSSTSGVNSTPNESQSNSGAAYIFVRAAGVWAQEAYLKPGDPTISRTYDLFGRNVAVSGETVVIGSAGENSFSPGAVTCDTGAAYVFVRSAGQWSQQAHLTLSSGVAQQGDLFGAGIAMSGDTIVVGAGEDGIGLNDGFTCSDFDRAGVGSAYVFVRNAGAWTLQAALKPPGGGRVRDRFGDSVVISGDTLVVATAFEDSSSRGVDSTPNTSATDAGAAYVFARSAGVWSQRAYLKPADVGITQAGDTFGAGIAISGDTVVIGAPLEDSATLGINSVPNEASSNAGAAYVFLLAAPTVTGPAISEVIDGGSLRPEIAASGWVTIKGSRLAPTTRIWVDSDFVQGKLPTVLNGVSVTIDGKPAAVYYISPTQINVLAGALTRTGSVPVVVTTPEGTTTFTATVKAQVPSWFMLDPEDRKYVAAVNADGSIVGKVGLYSSAPNFTKPLPKGARALIYGTSWGPTNPPAPEGTVFSGAYNIAGASIKIGGQAVVIEFAGVVTPGLFQFNIIAPNLQPGDYLIEGTINGVSTQPGAYITLGP